LAVLSGDDEGVRVQLDDGPGDRGHRGLRLAHRVDRGPGADHALREDGVGDLGQAGGRARHGRKHTEHGEYLHSGARTGAAARAGGRVCQSSRRSLMSSVSESASGPTTTWTTLPEESTPWAPAAFSAASSTLEGSLTSVRSRVMHASMSSMLSAPPSPATIAAALSAMWVFLPSLSERAGRPPRRRGGRPVKKRCGPRPRSRPCCGPMPSLDPLGTVS